MTAALLEIRKKWVNPDKDVEQIVMELNKWHLLFGQVIQIGLIGLQLLQ